MAVVRVGVMGCSAFALRAMIPALSDCDMTSLVCVSSRDAVKAQTAGEKFGCDWCVGYDALLEHPDVDVVYMPLPTGLHAEWCAKALAAGKHILVEKSFASDYASAHLLVEQARSSGLLVAENFQFQTHRQWTTIEDLIKAGRLGKVHLVRSTFGFPPLPRDNFRWNRQLGGGALLDAGAYVAKASHLLLGSGLDVLGVSQTIDPATGVDVYGEAIFKSHSGQVSQVAYGFDYFYQCRVEILGTEGKLTANRVFTAPPGLDVELTLETPEGTELVSVGTDNHYLNMWRKFAMDLQGGDFSSHWDTILEQARLLEGMRTIEDPLSPNSTDKGNE